MKRSPLPPRKNYIAHSSKSLPRVNATRKARKAAKYKAFLSSAVWKRLRKAALERAGNQCEFTFEEWMWNRCPETDKLTVHHLTYARFGGGELPDDLQVLCKAHHDRLEALKGKRLA